MAYPRIIFAILAMLFSAFAFAKMPKDIQKQVELFTKPYEFSEVKISSKGSYISLIKNTNNIRSLVILDAKTFQPTYVAKFSGDEEVGDYVWVNDERVVLSKVYNRGWKEEPEYYGELFAVNADGSKPKYIFGQLAGGLQTGTNIKKNTSIRAIGYIRSPLAHDAKSMLIKAYPIGNGSKGFMTRTHPQLYKVNVYSGKRRKVTTAPVTNANFLLDQDHQPIFATGTDKNNDIKTYRKVDGQWQPENTIQGNLTDFSLLSIADDNQHVYAKGALPNETQAVYRINIATGSQEKIVHNKNVDPLKYWKNDQTDELYAVEYVDGYPSYDFVRKDSREALRLKSLLKSIPGHQLHLVSDTLDGETSILFATNDRTPGDYYLYKAKENKIQKIVSIASWINPDDLADVKPISFQSRDGKTIHGYITMPYGIDHKNLPLVVEPHGGPAARDYWFYNANSQLLAQQGIATLQVNFRGSIGYGEAFEKSGNLKWGTAVQHDIIDGVKYVIEQGWIDRNRICIAGGSFGAYSALQSSILEPDLFKCAIGMAGVYDLPLMKNEGDIPSFSFGGSFLSEVIGNDPQTLKAMSPSHNVNKLKAKLLLVHGEKDKRTPIEQYEALADALDKANYPYEKMIFDKEGHGLYNPENQAKYYNRMLGFIKENLAL